MRITSIIFQILLWIALWLPTVFDVHSSERQTLSPSTEIYFQKKSNMKQIILDGLREKAPRGKQISDNNLRSVLTRLYPAQKWEYGKALKGCQGVGPLKRIIPDAYCEALKMVVEVDGDSVSRPNHYSDAKVVEKDAIKDRIYASAGYKVIRIPMFVQLDSDMIKYYFGLDYSESLYPASSLHGFDHPKITLPGNFCPRGYERFLRELHALPLRVANVVKESLCIRLNELHDEGFSYEEALNIVLPGGHWSDLEK